MTQVVRIRATWGGSGVVGPGLTTFYTATSGSGLPAAVRAYFEAIKSAIPTDVQITVPNSGDLIEDTNGELAGTWSEPSGGGVTTGTNAGVYSLGVGYRVKWVTSGIVGGRRVVGSTFIAPVAGAAFNSDGTLDSVTRVAHLAAAVAFKAAVPTLRILSREVEADPDHVPPIVHRDGTSSPVIDVLLPNAVSWLRSRRT